MFTQKKCFTKGNERNERKLVRCEYDDLKRWFIDKSGDLIFTRRRNACRKMEGFPVLYDKIVKGLKEKDAVQNTWEKVA